ncbi:DNA polymerase III subunit gamma/tau [Candidatus Gottesmanbacteria bacterium]|nr:DNA polymerase III subunit gamma/tau [Candidatus Gottesmanbacteria bacterium]
MSFYRIYRPKVLDELDNVTVRQTIERLLTKPKNELPHAYLLTGPKGTGKTTTARLIAKLFNCEKPESSGAPCGLCSQCKAISDGRHLDVLEIDAASNTGVDNIRDLRDRIALAPAQAPWKVYIIDEVHMLSTGAFNALLKTLEEPPSHAIFILATTDPQKIPATVTSRCQHISFSKAKNEDLVHALTRIAKKETMHIDDDALQFIADNADGSFRDAVKMLEQMSFIQGAVNIDLARQTLALSDDTRRNAFITFLLAHNTSGALGEIQKLVADGIDIKSFLVSCLALLEKRLVDHVCHAQSQENQTIESSSLSTLISRLTQAYSELRLSPIPELPLELAVIEYCHDDSQREAPSEPAIPETLPVVQSKPSVTPPHPNVNSDPAPVISTSPVISAKAHLAMAPAKRAVIQNKDTPSGLITLEKLDQHWKDVIDELKPYNHSVAGVMRSTRPKSVEDGIVTIEAFYPFHKEKLSEVKTREAIAEVFKKLFGEKVKVEVTLGKK